MLRSIFIGCILVGMIGIGVQGVLAGSVKIGVASFALALANALLLHG